MPWQPLITGEQATRVRRVLDNIRSTLFSGPEQSSDVDVLADRALACAYLSEDAEPAVNRLLSRLHEHVSPALYGGLARIGWTLAHLTDGDDVQANTRAMDEVLARSEVLAEIGFDLVHGLAGLGIYAIERGEEGLFLLSHVVDELHRRAEPRGTGLAWRTSSDAKWDLGVAHGVAGVIGFLARALAAGYEPARSLLDAAVAYLLELASPPPHAMGWYSTQESENVDARVAWCYGDLGIALALVGAGMYMEEPRWLDHGLAVALDCARRGTGDSLIRDACVCHGAAGNAHVFNRLAQATGSLELANAARSWLARALDFEATGFHPATHLDPMLTERRVGTILYGPPGVALVLHAAVSGDEPHWDRLLLADLPPQA